MAVLGDMRQTCTASLCDAAPGNIDAVDQDVAGENGAQSRQSFDELRLAISLDAGDAEDLARLDAEADTIDDASSARAHHAEVPDFQTLIRSRTGVLRARLHAFSPGQRYVATNH